MKRREQAAQLTSSLLARWRSTLPGHTLSRSQALDLGHYTLALAAQQLLCMVPLLVATSSVLHRVHEGSAAGLISDALGLNADGRHDLHVLLQPAATPGWGELVVGLLLAVAFTVGVAGTTQRILEIAWDRPRAPWQRWWWMRLVWVASLVPFLATAIWLSGRTRNWPIGGVLEIAIESITVGLSMGGFYWWTQWCLLLRRVPWAKLLPGSLLITLGATVVSVGSEIWLPGQVTEQVDDYGLVGTTFVLSVWVLVVSGVVVAGILVNAVIDERRAARRRGDSVRLADWRTRSDV
ncbi:YhjD/YihY/BrkB family envelope integrity protein [Allobranchiibius sp. CTAmp26]|uniref:YhjD/YihY/BrkB family envelope integrity protein n=1 Tax=Allobranchiibius sp. CTAmp26 TaxID=2815214 RepID=UPI001AA10B7E|nr:YhjD/YihY/BrkB family envelope integrity protein [Allobranchiibius sp. CTAmp26]MBO1754441.1 YihY/virulence factor BrkB family protein [Allobranchiibius sp. CTAmp26]